MAADPFAEQAAKLLAALDFSAEAAAREAQRRQELKAVLLPLLELMDAFDRLLGEGGPDGEEPPAAGDVPRRTVRLLARQLARCLREAGVVPLACLGEEVDPRVHEIAGTRQTAAAGADVIVEVVSGGYLWNGELLRRPRVIVAAGGMETEP